MRPRLQIFLLVLATLIVRSVWIGRDDLAHDEPFTILQAHRTLQGILMMLPEENNPPLHFLIMHFWVKLVPLQEGWLRLPSAIFSALTIWPLFLLALRHGGLRTAWVASLLFIFSDYQQGFAMEARTYSLFALLATTGMWQLSRVAAGKSIHWLVVVNVLLVYTHFFGWIMIGTQFLCVLLVREWRAGLRSFMISTGIVVASYLPYASIFLRRFSTSVGEGTWLAPPLPEELYNMIWRWSNAPVVAVLFLLVIILHVTATRAKGLLTRVTMIWTFVPLLGMFAASFLAPMFLDRYLIHASIGFHLLVAVSLSTPVQFSRIPRWLAGAGVAAVLFTFRPWLSNRPGPSLVVQAVESSRQPEEQVLIHPWWWCHTYAWHLDRRLFLDPEGLFDALAARNIRPLHGGELQETGLLHAGPVHLVVEGDQAAAELEEHLRSSGVDLTTQVPDRKVRVYTLR
jgi:mannosyltransferase